MNFKSQHFLSRLFLLFKLYLLQHEGKVRILTQHNSRNRFLIYFNLENNEKFRSLQSSIDSYFKNLFCYKAESRCNHTTTDNKEGEQLEDRRKVGENSCNSGDGTDQTGPILDVYDDDDDDDDT